MSKKAASSEREVKVIYVPPEGVRETARIAIVGEAPGANEELEQRPFAGSSGSLVRAAISNSEIPASRILIINAVCVRPPKNRKPTGAEITSWLPHLAYHLANIRTVIMLGRSAEDAVGQIEFPDRKNYYQMHHPSYVQRSKKDEQRQWVDALAHVLRVDL